ncbi:RND efflux system, outer membrane lipoprotein CmeC [hydrothermal vent metagenome]|uniref:RND efflux system, outer membrane lipoprotein CmeC n=1 Tax=hydrothermal vent metagenome TaxID=652676 RepID=A0A3B0RR62_9ZZZZ
MRSTDRTIKAPIRTSAVALSALLASSCASINQELLEAQLPDMPAVWSSEEQAGTPLTGDWVAAFNDNALYRLIDEALLRNNTFLAAAANLKQARASSKIARADLLPSLNTSFRSSRNAIVTDPTFAAQAGGSSTLSGLRAQDLEDQFGLDVDGDGKLDGLDLDGNGTAETDLPNRRLYINNYSLGAQIRWEIDLWGRLTDQTKAAYRDATAAEADLIGARLSIAARVSQAWFGLIEARQQRELAERDVKARESNLRVTDRRYERGVASSLDVRLSRSALGSSQASLALRQRLELESSRRLEVLLGRYPAAELEAAESLPELPRLAGVGAPGDLLARRPDLIAAEARMEASGLRARAARKQMLPQITLTSQINTSGPALADLIDPERLAGNLVGGLLQPVFQGGRIRANAKRAHAVAEASLFNYAQTVLTAYEEAENALAAESFLAVREEALKLAYEEAAAAEELTERRYASGAATIFNLLDSQTRRILSESQYIQAQQQRVSNRVLLYLAIGGDFLTDAKLAALSMGESE